MDKVYRLLDWLDMTQAVDWLQDLTNVPLSSRELLQLCESQQCYAYVDADCIVAEEVGKLEKVTAKGFHVVTNPLSAFGSGSLAPAIWTKGDTYNSLGAELLIEEFPTWKRGPIFQSSEIKALANKMNEASTPPNSAELEDLRTQLKKACESRENAWYLTDKYKAEREQLLDAAKQESTSREAALLRAEQAEAEVLELRRHLKDIQAKEITYRNAIEEIQTKATKYNNELEEERFALKAAKDDVAKLKEEIRLMAQAQRCAQEASEQDEAEEAARRYDEWTKEQSGHQPIAPATGLIFPYATKHLEAMRDAAIAHWVEHDRSKPAPYGIQKTVQTFLAARTGENARKLAELASAIKPDDLPKA